MAPPTVHVDVFPCIQPGEGYTTRTNRRRKTEFERSLPRRVDEVSLIKSARMTGRTHGWLYMATVDGLGGSWPLRRCSEWRRSARVDQPVAGQCALGVYRVHMYVWSRPPLAIVCGWIKPAWGMPSSRPWVRVPGWKRVDAWCGRHVMPWGCEYTPGHFPCRPTVAWQTCGSAAFDACSRHGTMPNANVLMITPEGL